MRITTKGQVTIPQDIRERLRLLPATEVVFEIDGNAVKMRRAPGTRNARGERIVEKLRGRATTTMSTAQLMKLTRGDP